MTCQLLLFLPATVTATAYRRGRWGAAVSAPADHASEPVAERLMPFLVRAAEAPSYASVALVKPESTGSHRWTKKDPSALAIETVGSDVDQILCFYMVLPS